MQIIGISDAHGKGMKRSTSRVRRSRVKVTGGQGHRRSKLDFEASPRHHL